MTSSSRSLRLGGLALLGLTAVALSLACGGGSSTSLPGGNTPTTTGPVNVSISDASTEDWATIGVKVLAIGLIPQGGSAASAVNVYTAPSQAPLVNLVQLDQLSELLGNVAVPVGTYTGAVLTLSANPGDVTLTSAADPSSGFAGTAATTYPASQIQIQGATGATGSLTVPVKVNLVSNLVVTASQSNALDLEFDLGHPAFIVDHFAPGDAAPYWAVNFNGPVRHHPALAENLVLRHLYGTVSAVSSDNTTVTVTKDFPTVPGANPETFTASTISVPILADASNGTLFYNLDSKPVTPTTVKDFSTVSSVLAKGEFVRVAARYQADGTLTATRIFASSTFNTVYVGPEGHVLHVNASADTFTVENEAGAGVPLTVNSATQFFFQTPAAALSGSTPIATGTAFLGSNLVRGFKVHATVDPTTTPMTALAVDIEIAKYDGSISSPSSTGFTYTRKFATATDDYTITLPYIAAATGNGTDPGTGAVLDGFKWWNFSLPTLVNSDPDGTSFTAATGGAVNFGGLYGAMKPWGVSYATWNDPAAANAWAARFTILEPIQLPLGTVGSAGFAAASNSFPLLLDGNTGGNAAGVMVDLDVLAQQATLAYQVDRTNKVITVSPQDLTTSTGLANVAAGLAAGSPVKVYGVPQADGSIKAYVIIYYTGTKPTA